MAQSYPLASSWLRLLIDTIDRTDLLIARTLRINQVLGAQVDTCAFSLKPAESYRSVVSSTKPVEGQECVVEVSTDSQVNWTRLFGGVVQRVSEVRLAHKVIRWDIQCSDYTALAQRVIVNAAYVNESIGSIVTDITNRFVPLVIASGIENPPARPAQVTFTRETAANAIQRVAQMAGYEWYINAHKHLVFFDPESPAKVASQSLTDTSNNFHDLTIEPRIDQIRNRVYAYSDTILSDEIVDEFTANGVQISIHLTHKNVIARLDTFMTLNGVAQVVGLQGARDESQLPDGAFVLDAAKGIVHTPTQTPRLDQGDVVVFRYRYTMPGATVREHPAAQRALARLEGTTYSGVVLADRPTIYWRLDERSGTRVVNYGTAGISASGMYVGAIDVVDGPLSGHQGIGRRFGFDDTISGPVPSWIAGSWTAIWPSGSYTMEGWMRPNNQWFNVGTEEATLFSTELTNPNFRLGYYGVVPPTGRPKYRADFNAWVHISGEPRFTAYDHLVQVYDQHNSTQRLFVNGVVISAYYGQQPANQITVTGLLVGGIRPGRRAQFDCAELAVYDYPLPDQRIQYHYDIGRWAGVREHVVVNNDVQNMEALIQVADNELAKYANPIVDVRWTSFVGGWQVGTAVPIAVTASGLGRAYTANVKIQSISVEALGAQTLRYGVRAETTRFNVLDYHTMLARMRQVSQHVGVEVVERQETTVVLMGGTADIVSI